MKRNYLVDAWLVIVLSLAFGAGLAGVQAALKPRIEANKLNDTLAQIPRLVPGAEKGERTEAGGAVVYRALDAAGQPVGWVVPARGQGFADIIEMLIGVDRELRRVTGLYVLDQKETPGLGDFITTENWRGQFKGKSLAQPLVVVKRKAEADGEIEAITGATISSDSVTGILNAALARFRASLAASPQ